MPVQEQAGGSIEDSGRSSSFESINSDIDDDVSEASGKRSVEQRNIEIAARETSVVFRLRLLIFAVLLIATAAVSGLVYVVSDQGYQRQYKVQYDGAAQQVHDAFFDILDSKLRPLASMAVAATAHGVDHNLAWPFVTLSSFQQRAASARSHKGVWSIWLCPTVSVDDREKWENEYVTGENAQWM